MGTPNHRTKIIRERNGRRHPGCTWCTRFFRLIRIQPASTDQQARFATHGRTGHQQANMHVTSGRLTPIIQAD